NVIFGNTNVLIYGNLTTTGSSSDSWFCPTWGSAGSYPGGIDAIAKTITINGNVAQNFVIYGNVTIADSSALYVYSGGTNQSMAIGGSLINNADGITHAGSSTPDVCNFTTIPVTFFGPNNAFITNTNGTPSTTFSTVTVNKGSSQATTLTCNIAGSLTIPNNNWLTLQNGTFIYKRVGSDLTIATTTSFAIPSTAGLYASTSNNVIIGNAATTTNPTLSLSGKLTLDALNTGTVFVGPNANTA